MIRRFMILALALALALCPVCCVAEGAGDMASSKILVAYFSCTGNTEQIAEYAAEALRADLYEIVPEIPYTDGDLNYSNPASRSSKEMGVDSARPAIASSVEHMEGYDTVILGYPIWWGKAPKIVCTFLECYDFSAKTIVPFCTSGSSGIGSSAEDLQALVEGSAEWMPGKRFSGGTDAQTVADWLGELGLTK